MQFENEKDVKEFIEKIGEHHAVNGIQEVWKAAKEGRGLKLLVEKDYRKPGFLNNDETHLFLTPPKTIHRIVADAVDDIIEMVWEKNGQVVFTENDLLKDYQRIALITRY
jgi:peptide subunit release factor 1 (eRF1)